VSHTVSSFPIGCLSPKITFGEIFPKGSLVMTASDVVLRRLIDIDELSRLWKVPKATLYNWANQGRIPYIKIGRCVRFSIDQLADFQSHCTHNDGARQNRRRSQ